MSVTHSNGLFVDRAVPRVLVVGTGRGVGTTTVVLGLVSALKKAGTSVAVGYIGPSLVQTTYYRRVLGRLVQTLDPWCLNREQFAEELVRLSSGSELAVLEAEAGLYDRYGDNFTFESAAQVAESVDIPTLLVIDARGYREGVAAVVQGFLSLNTKVKLAGVICNFVESPAHNRVLKRAVESVKGPAYLGGVYFSQGLAEAAATSQDDNPSLLPRARVVASTELVEAGVQIAKVQEIGATARLLKVPRELTESKPRQVRVGVADDMVFHLTYQDNLDLIRREGGELVAFSPLVDSKLPPRVSALYFPGGYPQLYAGNLSANRAMVQALQDFVSRGGVIYAEGAAVAYLCRRATCTGQTFEMAGVIPGNATLNEQTEQPAPRGGEAKKTKDLETKSSLRYCLAKSVDESPLGPAGTVVKGSRDYRWNIRLEAKVQYALELKLRSADSGTIFEGLMPKPTVLATSAHLHWASNPSVAAAFIRAALGARRLLGVEETSTVE